MAFYSRSRLFRSYCGWSTSLIEAAKHARSLTLRKDFSYDRWRQELVTPFHEVEVVPHFVQDRVFRNRFDKVEGERHINFDTFCAGYMLYLKQAIVSIWKPYKVHVFATSSGFDSRCITMAIKQLAEQYGSDWLGRVLFYEANGESEQFKQLMEAEGWSKDQYLSCYDCSVRPTEYHAYSFDFSKAYYRLNGFISYPVNGWYTPIEWLQEQGIIPGDDQIQCFTMYGANETTRTNKHLHQGLDFYFWWHYHHMLSAFPLKGEWVHPSYHDELLRYLQVNREYLTGISDALSVCSIVAPHLFPELKHIKKMNTTDVEFQGYLHPSPKIIEQTVKDYHNSWYGKNAHPEVKPAYDIEYRNWWGHWATASMCEHLIMNRRRIEID